uniref:Dihydroxyacetone kinase n=1 Tax=Pyricularia oryzae (strain 70-15 / ATCC MYA-4617 / FGSC 8958) TaxID=242507 RepID=Q2KEY8_PYRO7|nr:hypothetical protein MGCH7_ch7g898 [Pyricularia oryzae 70-15]
MSKRHLFPSSTGLVPKALRGIVAYNPSLSLDETNRVVFDTTHPTSQVSLISGGGSGHEPAWSGYVGTNMLAASVAGDIFASPSTKQILAGIAAVPSDKGSILVITNYTGDCLHFGLAAEKAGPKCRVLICGDDVSVGRRGSLVGRRGLAGQIGVLKIVSIAATLDHCHVPGRAEHGMLDPDEVEIGTGPHNEPGYRKISPHPSPEQLVAEVLRYCLDEKDPERAYVKFAPGDETFLLVSNFGGMSHLEMGALVDELLEQLARDWNLHPARVYCGPLETSLNAPAFSVSVVNVTAAAAACKYSVDDIKAFADFVKPPAEAQRTVDPARDLTADAATLEAMLRRACEQLARAEPDLTKWDMVMGDGDCGETLKTGADHLLAALDKGLARGGSVVAVLHELEDIVESKMGGTLGGILGILFVAFRNGVERRAAEGAAAAQADLVGSLAAALLEGLASLERYTPAKVGDRTVMDTLIPFAQALQKDGFEAAAKAAVEGSEATRGMKPRLGRATYVGAGSEGGELPPDPGAWGARVAIEGLFSGWK